MNHWLSLLGAAIVRPNSSSFLPFAEFQLSSGVSAPSLTQKWVPVPLNLNIGSPWMLIATVLPDGGSGAAGGWRGGVIGGGLVRRPSSISSAKLVSSTMSSSPPVEQ